MRASILFLVSLVSVQTAFAQTATQPTPLPGKHIPATVLMELRALEVSSDEIERLCALAVEAGAIGAKLTGGGGGGCVIALAPGRESEVRGAWERAGFVSFATAVGGPAA